MSCVFSTFYIKKPYLSQNCRRIPTQVCENLWSRLWEAEIKDRITIEREELPDTKIWDEQESKRQNRLCRESKCYHGFLKKE